MKTFFAFLVIAIFLCVCKAIAGPFDTGFVTWTQPNAVTFTARYWGDEFGWRMETPSGYRIIKGGSGWYYYATLNASGDYTPTSSRVGIDSPPPAGSYKLERSPSCMNTINQQRAQADSQITAAGQWFAQKQAAAGSNPVVLNVGVILVEFADVQHYRDTANPNLQFGSLLSNC